MRPARRRERGTTLVEVVLSLGAVLALVAGAGAVAKSSGDLAASSGLADGAARRVQQVLDAARDEIRRVSLKSIRAPGGSDFADGATADGIGYRRVLGFQGMMQLDSPSTLRWVVPSGATEGDVVLSDGALEQTIARHVTEFAVTRTGDTFTVRVAVRMGPQDDRGRVARGTVSVQPRNP